MSATNSKSKRTSRDTKRRALAHAALAFAAAVPRAQSLAQSSSSSWVELRHPATGCHVVLVGCLHGSSSSARDVERVLRDDVVDVVALELCEHRRAGLERDSDRRSASNLSLVDAVLEHAAMVGRVARARGVGSAASAALLGGAASLQAASSGFEPGREFSAALAYARANDCETATCDQDQNVTLRRFGDIPRVSWDRARALALGSDEDRARALDDAAADGEALSWAIAGRSRRDDDDDDDDVVVPTIDMVRVLAERPDVRGDLARLTLPPLLAATVAVLAFDLSWDDLFGVNEATTTVAFDAARFLGSVLRQSASSVAVLAASYLGLALPMAKVILRERDDVLAEGIASACESVARKRRRRATNDDDDNDVGRVVAVLGMLHVNGVARRLLRTRRDVSLEPTERRVL